MGCGERRDCRRGGYLRGEFWTLHMKYIRYGACAALLGEPIASKCLVKVYGNDF